MPQCLRGIPPKIIAEIQMLESRTASMSGHLRFEFLAPYLVYEPFYVLLCVLRRRKVCEDFLTLPLQGSPLVSAESLPKDFADASVFFAGYLLNLLCHRLWEADGEDARLACAWSRHGWIITE